MIGWVGACVKREYVCACVCVFDVCACVCACVCMCVWWVGVVVTEKIDNKGTNLLNKLTGW